MKKRHKIGKKASKKHFSKNAKMTHKKNMPTRVPMRGGIRM